MMIMTMTMPLAAVDMETHNAPRLISMMQFPPNDLRPGRTFLLIQFEIDGEIEDDIDRLPVESTRPEFPAFDRIDRGLIETERQRLEDMDVGHVAIAADRALDDDDAGDAGLAGHFRILRLDAIDDHRRLDVAADAQRSVWLRRRRRFGDHAADHAADDTAGHAAFDATFNAAFDTRRRRLGSHRLHLFRHG